MDLGLLNYINVDLKWNVVKKGRRSVTRRPRKPGADNFGLGNNPAAFDAKKSGTDVLGGHFAEKVVDAPLKKRRLLRQSLSPAPQTPCLHGERDLSPEPQTPSVHHEDSSQRSHSNSLSLSRKTKSKSGSRNSNILKKTKKVVSNLDDFSGIELLAAAACSSFLHDNADHVEDFSVLKEQTTPGVNSSCTVDMKEAIISTTGSSNRDDMVPDTPILHDNGNEEGKKKVAPSKGLRLHWDLNTVMDDWEEPSNSLLVEPSTHESSSNGGLKGGNLNLEGCEGRFTEVEPHSPQLSGKHDAALSVVPVVEKSNDDSFGKTYELIEDLVCSGTKIASKISDGESSVSKSDVVDSLIHLDKCEDYSTSTTSVLREQTIVKCEADTIDNHLEYSNHKNTISKSDQQPVSEEMMQEGCPSPKLCTSYSDKKVASEDPLTLSECCGSDVTQDEQGHMAEGDTMGKVQVGYDSPFEDGELREPIGWEENEVVEKETVYYKSDNIYKNDYGTIENSLPASRERGQAMEDQHSLLVNKNGIEQDAQADTFERPRTSFQETDYASRKEIPGRKNGDSESRPLRESTSVDGCRNGAYIRGSRSNNIGDSYNSRSGRDLGPCVDSSSTRIFDLKSSHEYHRPRNVTGDPVIRSGKGRRSLDRHQFRNYDPRGGYRRPSPSERNNGYGISRGRPVRSVSRDRYRGGSGFHPQGFRRSPEEEYHERKPRCFSPNFNRSRSGSPIAWHFQKRRNLDTDDDDQKPSNLDTNDDKRQVAAVVVTTIGRNQRFERLKSDDDFRFSQRSGPVSVREHKYKDNGRKHDHQ